MKSVTEGRSKVIDLMYHNFSHAVDSLQFLGYEIKTGKIASCVTNTELLGMAIACLCMGIGYRDDDMAMSASGDIGHRMVNSDKSTRTTRSCAVAVNILSEKESNILKSLKEAELKDVWNWIILLITNTDLAYHFKVIASANRSIKEGSVNWTDQGQKLTNMTLLLKAASVAQICRPREICEKWHLLIREEMLLDKRHQTPEDFLESIDNLEKRARNTRMRDQIAYAGLIAMPILKAVSGICTNLAPMYGAAETNLQRWKDHFFCPPEPKLKSYM